MRSLLRLLPLLLLLLLPGRSQAAGVEIVRVFTGWRDAASFQRVSEYFDGRENTGGIIPLRSQPARRAGFYWLVRLKNTDLPLAGAKFELQIITPASPEPRTFTFPTDIPAGSPVYQLGLTGADWPDAKIRPVAWQLRLLAAGGKTLIAKESFLWEMPEK
ncbi:MAG: hypothetical protein PHE83_08330 [Opitutaceae bacterium]|nr:hypothetical protein [Opitutaceae bacterium]